MGLQNTSYRRYETLESRKLFAAGDVDPSFGVGGTVSDPERAEISVGEITVLAGDKILLVGSIQHPTTHEPDDLLRRFNADGSIDTSFGSDGSVSGRFTANPTRIDDIEFTSDGKFYALGREDTGAPDDRVIARFNADATLDTSFSGDGVVPFKGMGGELAVQSDDKVLVTGDTRLIRFTTAGELDSSFGAGGIAQDVVGEFITAVSPLSGGKILVGGFDDFQGSVTVVRRLNADGSIDSTFGTAGTLNSELEELRDIRLLPDGRFIVGGNVGRSIGAVRHAADGAVDATFGTHGKTLVPFGAFGTFGKVLIDDQDRIYITTFGASAARLTPDGDFDESFGRVFGGGSGGWGLQSTGRLVMGGDSGNRDLDSVILIGRMTDDVNPSPIALSGRTVNLTGTSGDDRIFAENTPFYVEEQANYIFAKISEFGRVFDGADVDLVSVLGGDGNDRVHTNLNDFSAFVNGGNGRDKITGGQKNDTLMGGAQRDFIDGGWGADLVVGNGGNDQLRGQGGKDRVYGRVGNDYVGGENGDDRLRGDGGIDLLVGGEGNDQLFADDDIADSLIGGNGDDSAATDELDVLESIETLV